VDVRAGWHGRDTRFGVMSGRQKGGLFEKRGK